MEKKITRTIVGCLAFMLIVLGLFINRITADKDLSIEEFKDLGAYIILPNRKLEGFVLLDSNEGMFIPEDFNGKWNILFFGFTFCPDICPITMSMLSAIESDLEEKISDEINFYMVSVDPKRDTPKKLKQYLRSFNKNFIGLTGELDQIYKFATQVNAPFMPVADTSDPYYTVDHTGSIVILSPEGRYAGFFRTPHNKENIIKVLNALVNQNK